jgi:hypothetical protein
MSTQLVLCLFLLVYLLGCFISWRKIDRTESELHTQTTQPTMVPKTGGSS